MSIEVSCPKCQSRLKAPEGMTGKKARCKKCQHSFRIAGSAEVDSVGDSEHLSAIDSPFAFTEALTETPPAQKPVRPDKVSPPPVEAASGGSNPFQIPVGPTPHEDKPEPRAKAKAKGSVYQSRGLNSTTKSRPSIKRFVLLLLGALLCAGGGAGGIYFYLQSTKPTPSNTNDKTTTAQVPSEAVPNNDPPTPTAKAAVAQPPDTTEPKGAVAARTRKGPNVTGGIELPPPAKNPKLLEKAKTTMILDHPVNEIKQLIVGGAEGPVLLVVRRTFEGLSGRGMKDTIDRYALNTGRLQDQTEVSADAVKSYPRIGDVSPSGDLYAYEHPEGKLTISQLGTKTLVIDRLDLNDETEKKSHHPGVAAIYFLTEDLVAVVTKIGTVETWDIPSKKKVSSSEAVAGAANLVDRRTVTIHRDRQPMQSQFFIYAGGAIHAVTPGGKPRSVLSLPRQPSAGLALAVDGSGNRLAVAYTATAPGEHIRFGHARVGDPELAGDQHLAASVGLPVFLEWTRPETFTLLTEQRQGLAYDAETGTLIAGIQSQSPNPIIVADGSRHWCLMPEPKNPKKSLVVEVTIPPDSYSPSLVGGKQAPESLLITPEGVMK